MTLRDRINEDVKTAMRARDSARLGALRLLTAALKQREVDERIVLDDAGVVAILEKLLKQRRESITQFEAAGRTDLVAGERFELELLSGYMPAALGDEEIEAAVADAIAQSGATSPRDMGKVMAILKPALAGRADMTRVSSLVKGQLVG